VADLAEEEYFSYFENCTKAEFMDYLLRQIQSGNNGAATVFTKEAKLDEEDEAKEHELSDIQVAEISLVDRPANRKQFLLTKNTEGQSMMNGIDNLIFMAKSESAATLDPGLYLNACESIAKSNQKPDETFEGAFVRAIDTDPDAKVLYTAYRAADMVKAMKTPKGEDEYGYATPKKAGQLWKEIEDGAQAYRDEMQRQGKKLTKEQAVSHFVGTPEGRKMNNDYEKACDEENKTREVA
jgi:hypothetical protein